MWWLIYSLICGCKWSESSGFIFTLSSMTARPLQRRIRATVKKIKLKKKVNLEFFLRSHFLVLQWQPDPVCLKSICELHHIRSIRADSRSVPAWWPCYRTWTKFYDPYHSLVAVGVGEAVGGLWCSLEEGGSSSRCVVFLCLMDVIHVEQEGEKTSPPWH